MKTVERDVGRFVEISQENGVAVRKRVPSGRKVKVPVLGPEDLEVSDEVAKTVGKAHVLECANAGLDLAARRKPAKRAATAKKMAAAAETDAGGLVEAIKCGTLEAYLEGLDRKDLDDEEN